MTSISRTSLAPFFPKGLCSSPFISAGAGPSSTSDVLSRLFPRLFLLVLVLLPLITSCSLYDDPLLFPVTDGGSDSEGVVFPSIDNGDFSVIPEIISLLKNTSLTLTS